MFQSIHSITMFDLTVSGEPSVPHMGVSSGITGVTVASSDPIGQGPWPVGIWNVSRSTGGCMMLINKNITENFKTLAAVSVVRMDEERRKPVTKQDLKDVIQGTEYMISQLHNELDRRIAQVRRLEKQLSKSRAK